MIHIISEDDIFARMLELEISSTTSCPVYTSGTVPDIRDDCILIILDTDISDEFNILQLEEKAAVICFSRRDNSHNSNIYFKRPFLINEFVQVVDLIIEKSPKNVAKNEVKRGRKSENSAPRLDISINKKKKKVFFRGEEILLSPKEFTLLCLLYDNRGKVVTREKIIFTIWKNKNQNDSNLADVYITYLRNKIDKHFDIRLIVAVRGRGYLMRNIY